MKGILKPFKEVGKRLSWYGENFAKGDIFVKLSYFIMGMSNIARKQIVKGLGYLILEISFLVFMIMFGVSNMVNLTTLGTKQQDKVFDEASGMFVFIQGDNSMHMLLAGVVTLGVIVFFVIMWASSIKSGAYVYELKLRGKKINGIIQDVKDLFDTNIHRLLLFIPMLGLVVFTVLPLVYMILMAFTNYDVDHQPPGNLFTWIGLENFRVLLLSGGAIAKTFWPILGWTLVWAVFATFTNYFAGMLLAMLINMKGIKAKKLWRTIFVITIAVPSFVSLMVVRTMLNQNGIINILLQNLGFTETALPFLTNATWARATVIIVNMWIGIPHTMLITTGILMNIPSELYESAKIDGASPFKTFMKITLPYMWFVTTPYLISNFIANVNNFNPIYFLTGGGPETLEYFKGAGKTDLLVTWLYKLTKDSKDYCYASAIGIVIFIISAVMSLIVYRRTSAYKDEEGFQ